jgi:hypothetical protein
MDENFHNVPSSSSSSGTGGCILQSMVCWTKTDLVQFLSSVPSQRIIIMVGAFRNVNNNYKNSSNQNGTNTNDESIVESNEPTVMALKRLLGDHFNIEYVQNDGIIYIGQLLVAKQPDWAYCGSYSMTPHGIKFVVSQQQVPMLPPHPNNDNTTITAATTTTTAASTSNDEHKYHEVDQDRFRLKTFRNVCPQSIIGRVPDTIMTLSEQLIEGYEKKCAAFVSFMKQKQQYTQQLQEHREQLVQINETKSVTNSGQSGNNPPNFSLQRCYGCTTRNGAPLYLLGASSYPLVPCRRRVNDESTIGIESNSKYDCWNTFLWLPSELVPENDGNIIDTDINMTKSSPNYDVPIDQEFFQRELGSHLLLSMSSSARDQCQLPTNDVLYNTRLVAYYFSAHWCGRT